MPQQKVKRGLSYVLWSLIIKSDKKVLPFRVEILPDSKRLRFFLMSGYLIKDHKELPKLKMSLCDKGLYQNIVIYFL